MVLAVVTSVAHISRSANCPVNYIWGIVTFTQNCACSCGIGCGYISRTHQQVCLKPPNGSGVMFVVAASVVHTTRSIPNCPESLLWLHQTHTPVDMCRLTSNKNTIHQKLSIYCDVFIGELMLYLICLYTCGSAANCPVSLVWCWLCYAKHIHPPSLNVDALVALRHFFLFNDLYLSLSPQLLWGLVHLAKGSEWWQRQISMTTSPPAWHARRFCQC